jgi:hypothetical protein
MSQEPESTNEFEARYLPQVCEPLAVLMREYKTAWGSDVFYASASPVLVIFDVCLATDLSPEEMRYIFGQALLRKIEKFVSNPVQVKATKQMTEALAAD